MRNESDFGLFDWIAGRYSAECRDPLSDQIRQLMCFFVRFP
jgi:hypothetical protein